jgi:hypothetical protein
MKCTHHQTKYIGKYVGLRTYQHPCIERKCLGGLDITGKMKIKWKQTLRLDI